MLASLVVERPATFARPAGAGQGRRLAAVVLLLAASASAEPRSPFASWAGDVAAPSTRSARPFLGRLVTVETPAGSFLDAGRPLAASLDSSLPLVRADEAGRARRGGRGVFVAIVDGGVDFTHRAFRNDDGSTRIAWYLDMTQPSRGNLASLDDLGFALYGRDDLDRALADPGAARPSGDPTGHGTRVASIAAGGAAPYPGVAPEADLIVVRADRLPGFRFDEADVADALRFVFSAADLAGRPCVANVSLGGQLGAHDGTSVLERALDELALAGPTGRAIVVAAGNDARDAVHAVLDPEARAAATVTIPHNAPIADGQRAVAWIDLWSSPDRPFSLRVTLPDGTIADTADDGPAIERDLGRGASMRVELAEESRPDSRRFEALVALTGGDDGSIPAGAYRLEVSGDGPVDAYLSTEAIDSLFPVRLAGDVRREGTLAVPATARGAIVVGAMVGRTGWRNHLGEWLEDPSVVTGAVATFSGLGPTADGRLKPDLLAPGVWVIAANADGIEFPIGPGGLVATGRDSAFSASSGTSLAAPHVAGVVALILAGEPGLSSRELLDRLRATANADGSWSPTAGFGLVDAFAALTAPPAATASERVRPVLSIARPSLNARGDRRTEVAVAVRTEGGAPRAAEGVGLRLPFGVSGPSLRDDGVAATIVSADGMADGRCAPLSARTASGAEATGNICLADTGVPDGCSAAGALAPTRWTPLAWLAMLAGVTAAGPRIRSVRRRSNETARWWPFALASLAINAAVVPLVVVALPDASSRGREDPLSVALLDRQRPAPPVEVAVEALPPAPGPAEPATVPAAPTTPRPSRTGSRPRAVPATVAETTPAAGSTGPAAPPVPGGVASSEALTIPLAAGPETGAAAAAPTDVARPATADQRPAASPPDPCLSAGAAVRARIDAAKAYPPLARRRRVSGTTVVSFGLDASGALARADVADSSGSDLLDGAALAAVRAAAPFPAAGCSYSVPVQFRIDGR